MIGRLVVRSLLGDQEYGRKVLPFLQGGYFRDRVDRSLFEVVKWFVETYNDFPTPEAVAIDLAKKDPHTAVQLTDEEFEEAKTVLQDGIDPDTNREWLVDETEKFCRFEALNNAIFEAVDIIEDKSGKKSTGIIPELLQSALAISFDVRVGHDYIDDAELRWDEIHRPHKRVPCDIELINRILRGGFPAKTISIFLAGTHVGKTFVMCHLAASQLVQGKNVLYITLEMSEHQISTRIDANLLGVDSDLLETLPKELFLRKIAHVKEKTKGKLIVQEFPTAGANVNDFRRLIRELKIKRNFVPDIIYVDYVNICTSIRIKDSSDSYGYVKAITEELRGLAVENDVPLVTATQTNRSGSKSSDPDMTDTAESWGLPQTADVMIALVRNDELDALGQLMAIQLKNRVTNMNKLKRFCVGVDMSKFRLYDVEMSAQRALLQPSSTTPIAVAPIGFGKKPVPAFAGFK